MTREITIVTPENVELTFELAGIGSRFVAVLTDTLIQALTSAALIVSLMLFAGASVDWFQSLSTWIIALYVLLLFALWGGYFLFFEATRNGQTPGKKSVGIRVVRDSGHPVDFRAALLRNIMRIVDGLPGMYGVGFVSVFLSPQYRRLGDYTAGTLVVKTRQTPRSAAILTMPQDEAAETAAAQVVSLLPPEAVPYLHLITKDDYRAIRHFLDRRRELEPPITLSMAEKLSTPLIVKLHIAPETIQDRVFFLENLSGEWERRMIR